MSETTPTHITGVRTVSVPVDDQDRALEFYRDILGFEPRLDATYGNGQRWIELAVPGAATTIALSPPAPGEACGIDTGIRFLTSDAEADYAELQARGVTIDGPLMRWPNVPAMFMLRDPDGNLLRVIEDATQEQRGRQDRTRQEGGRPRRFAVLVKSNAAVEAGAMPREEDLASMTRFNDELVESGAMLAGEGFHASSTGARLTYSSGGVRVVPGPFPEPEKLVAGFWMILAGSLDEAVELMKRAPMDDGDEVEIRQVFDAEDFGVELTPELREREERQRLMMERNARRRAA